MRKRSHPRELPYFLPSAQNVPTYPMSSPSNAASSNFEVLFSASLTEYTKQTRKDLRDHRPNDKIDGCDNPDSILDILQEQAREFDGFRKGDTKLFM